MRSALAVAVVVAVVMAAGAAFAVGVLGVGNGASTSNMAAPPAAVVAAGVPSSAVPTPTASPSPPPTAVVTPAPTVAVSPPTAPVVAPLTYTVVPGDNLSTIAGWFHIHGYGALYEANKAVLGDNPNLIYPGQQITITNNGMTMG